MRVPPSWHHLIWITSQRPHLLISSLEVGGGRALAFNRWIWRGHKHSVYNIHHFLGKHSYSLACCLKFLFCSWYWDKMFSCTQITCFALLHNYNTGHMQNYEVIEVLFGAPALSQIPYACLCLSIFFCRRRIKGHLKPPCSMAKLQTPSSWVAEISPSVVDSGHGSNHLSCICCQCSY